MAGWFPSPADWDRLLYFGRIGQHLLYLDTESGERWEYSPLLGTMRQYRERGPVTGRTVRLMQGL